MEAGDGLLAGKHHAGLQRLLADTIGDHLIDRDAGMQDGSLFEVRAGEKTAGLRGVNAQTHRALVEEPVDDVDLAL